MIISDDFMKGFLLGGLSLFILLLTVDIISDDIVHSDKPIQYELKIEVDQSGKADTTYIYREP